MRSVRPFNRLILAACLVAPVVAPPARAQDPPLKWGKIPAEDLALTSWEADTAASAVILANYGETVVHPTRWTLEFRQHTRIKILDEAGYDLATVVIPYMDGVVHMGKVEGQTFVVDDRGKVVKTKLEKGDIFHEEQEGDRRTVRFTLPALAPGAVIEYRYTWTADRPTVVPDWAFQATEPTRWSEYRLETPRTLAYAISRTGVVAFEIEETTPILRPIGETQLRRWVMKDVPALREEPFMARVADYRASVSFQLAEYLDPAQGVRKMWGTWQSLARDLLDYDLFGGQLDPGGAVRTQAQSLVESMDDPTERMIAIHAYVATSVDWNGTFGPVADRPVDEVLRTGSGSVAETALLLTAMLRAAGVDAHPVLLSTRLTGQSRELYPMVDQFDYVLTAALVRGKTVILDATDRHRPHDQLPVLALNGRGWLVHRTEPRWIPIQSTAFFARREAIHAALNGDGGIRATIETVDEGYSAASMRSAAADGDEREVVEEQILDGIPNFVLGRAEIEQPGSLSEPVTTRAEIEVPAWATEVGDLMYLNPVITDLWKENPLKSPERHFPVDLGYPRRHVYEADFELPPDFVVESLPAELRFRPPKAAGMYERRVVADSSGVHVAVTFELTRSVFETRDYDDLRTFLERVAVTQSDQIVLARRRNP